MRRLAAVFFILALPVLGEAQLRISTDKDSLDFTKVKVGFSRDGTIRVSNISLVTVFINDMTILPQNSVTGEFQIIVPSPPVYHVDSGDGRTIIIRFKPNVTGFRTAALDIFTDDGIKEIELIGEGSTIQPDILLKPQFIDFGTLAPGEFKDTTLTLIGGDKDSATVTWVNVANDNAAIHFDVTPLDPSAVFPLGVASGDTLKLNVRFSAFNSSGLRTGRALMEGEVSGEVLCEFRGSVGIPNMVFSPQLLDLGIVQQGSVVDTFITIASIGETSVKLQEVLPPGLPYYSISNIPSLPYPIFPNDSLKIGIHFSADLPGDWEDAINAYSKNGSASRINKSALIKAIVIPRVLSKISPIPFVVSCAIDSTYSRTLTITDTGNFGIFISGINCSNPEFSISYPSPFPDTLITGSKRNITITFKPNLGSVVKNKTCIVNVMTGGRIILSDTILLITQSENVQLAAVPLTSINTVQYSNTVGILSVNDLARYQISSLEMEMSVDPPDIAEIDIANVTLNTTILPNAALKITFDQTTKKYLAVISSTSNLSSLPSVPFLHVPLRYFVAKESSAIFRIVARSPEKDGCVNFTVDSFIVKNTDVCGDMQIRNFFNNIPLLSAVSISPNPSSGKQINVSFVGVENILLSSEIFDMTGKIIVRHSAISFKKGENILAMSVVNLPSGEYSLHLIARTSDGQSQDVFDKIILSR